jgi:hypothetical protein
MFEKLINLIPNILAFFMYIVIPFIIVFKIFKRKKLPNNEYTPYDDILLGRSRREAYTKDMLQDDLKHEIQYEEVYDMDRENDTHNH